MNRVAIDANSARHKQLMIFIIFNLTLDKPWISWVTHLMGHTISARITLPIKRWPKKDSKVLSFIISYHDRRYRRGDDLFALLLISMKKCGLSAKLHECYQFKPLHQWCDPSVQTCWSRLGNELDLHALSGPTITGVNKFVLFCCELTWRVDCSRARHMFDLPDTQHSVHTHACWILHLVSQLWGIVYEVGPCREGPFCRSLLLTFLHVVSLWHHTFHLLRSLRQNCICEVMTVYRNNVCKNSKVERRKNLWI